MSQDDWNTNRDDDPATHMGRVISELVTGNSGIAGVLTSVIETALGNTLRSNMHFPGGTSSMTSGYPSVFGSQDVGLNLAAAIQKKTMTSVMGGAADALSARQKQDNMAWNNFFNPGLSTEEQEANALKPSWTNLLSNTMLGSANLRELMPGLRTGLGYMGAGYALPSDAASYSHQIETNARLKKLGEGVMADAAADIGSYGGLKGKGIGQVFSELSRGGGFNQFQDLEIDDQVAAVARTTQKAAQSIQAFRQVFKGSVTEAMDQMNSLMGVDVVQTFGDNALGMGRQFAATGYTAGLSPSQTAAMGGYARDMLIAGGVSPTGSIASAERAMTMFQAFREGNPDGSKFINTAGLRTSMLQQAVLAQESGMARDVSGGYAMVMRELGSSGADKFVETLRGRNDLTSADIAKEVSKATQIPTSALDLRHASNSREAEDARLRGIGGSVAMTASHDALRNGRKAMLMSIIGGKYGTEKAQNIIDKASSGGFTLASIKEAVTSEGFARDDQALIGQITGSLNEQAEFLNLGDVYSADAQIIAGRNQTVLKGIETRVDSRIKLQDLFQDKGNVSGFLNFRDIIKDGDKDNVTARAFFGALFANADITEDETAEALGVGKELLKNINNDTESFDLAGLGLDVAVRGLATMTVAGKLITKKQADRFRAVISPDSDLSMDARMDELRAISKLGFEKDIYAGKVKMRAAGLGFTTDEEGDMGDLSGIQQLVTLTEIMDLEKGPQLAMGDKAKKTFLSDAETLRAFTEKQIKSNVRDVTKINRLFAEKYPDEDERNVMGTALREAIVNPDVGTAATTTPIELAIQAIIGIETLLKNSPLGGK